MPENVNDDIAEIIRANRELQRSNELLQAKICEQRRIEELLVLQRDLAVTLSSANSIKEALAQIFDAALKIDGIDGGAVYLVDEAGGVNMVLHKGLSARFIKSCSNCGPDSRKGAHSQGRRMGLQGSLVYCFISV